MKRFFKIYLLLLAIPIISAQTTISLENATDLLDNTTTTTTISPATSFSSAASTEPPSPLPTLAAKLVRLRRQPLTIVRHIYRSSKRNKPRRRVKRPKIKYGPPQYSYGEPLTYYKPKVPPPAIEHPSFSIEDFEHLNLNAADFDLPTSSYEGQSMDLDLYSHDDSLYDTPKLSKIEYSAYDIEPALPSYSYTPSKAEISAPRKPHSTYGVPEEYEHSNRGFDSHAGAGHYDVSNILPADAIHVSSGDSHYDAPQSFDTHPVSSYKAPSSSYSGKSHSYFEVDPSIVPHIPSTQYGVPDTHIPVSYNPPKTDYHASVTGSQDSSSTYRKKIPNSGYSSNVGHHSFAEPPAHTDIEITYSPSYEISLPPSSNHKPPDSSYSHPSQANFAEPPAHSAHQPPPYAAIPPEHSDTPSYSTPAEHVPPADSHTPPDNSYSAPPGPPHGDPSHTPNYSAHPERPPPPPDYSNTRTYSAHPGPAEDYLPPTKELPLNTNHMQPAYDYPKSSYEVPIYDPIPFEASNQNEQEYYPPHAPPGTFSPPNEAPPKRGESESKVSYNDNQSSSPDDASSEESTEDAHPASTSTTSGHRVIRQRNRGRASTPNASIKHILDVPELEQAFEAHNRNKYRTSHTDADVDVDESNNVEKQNSNYLLPTIPPGTGNEQYVSHAWNPMRIRTSPRIVTTPTTTLETEARPAATSNRPRHRNQFRGQKRQPAPAATNDNTASSTRQVTPPNGEKVSIISIEKSRSQSYYDGTVAPPTLTMSNLYQTRFRMPTRQPSAVSSPDKDVIGSHRTTKSVFDTTYFKSPRNDKSVERKRSALGQSLPKNHKLF